MQANKGAAKKAAREMSKAEKQQAREKAQMEKQAFKDGGKRAFDDSKPGKGPAAKKCVLHPLATLLPLVLIGKDQAYLTSAAHRL